MYSFSIMFSRMFSTKGLPKGCLSPAISQTHDQNNLRLHFSKVNSVPILFSTPSLTIQWRPQQAVEFVNRGVRTQRIKKCWNRHNYCDLFILPVLLLVQLIWFSLDNCCKQQSHKWSQKKIDIFIFLQLWFLHANNSTWPHILIFNGSQTLS